MLWRRPRLSLILCAFSIHAWQLTRRERWADDASSAWYARCVRCGQLRVRP